MSLTAVAAALTVPAPGRASNDGVVITERVFGVADGTDDGDASGQHALLEVLRLLGPRPRPRDLRPALHATDIALWCRDGGDDHLVATVTIAVWTGDRLALGHIGDSRGYLVRGRHVEQLTTDHATSGASDDGVARLGQRQTYQLELRLLRLRDGDRLILCTDGLWRSLADEHYAMTTALEPTDACAVLARAAKGGDEEASVVVVAFSADGDE